MFSLLTQQYMNINIDSSVCGSSNKNMIDFMTVLVNSG